MLVSVSPRIDIVENMLTMLATNYRTEVYILVTSPFW